MCMNICIYKKSLVRRVNANSCTAEENQMFRDEEEGTCRHLPDKVFTLKARIGQKRLKARFAP